MSASKFLCSYENELKKFTSAHRKPTLIDRLENRIGKEDARYLRDKFIENLSDLSSSNRESSNNNMILSNKSTVDLSKCGETVADQERIQLPRVTRWKLDGNGDVAHKSVSENQSLLTNLNDTSTVEDGYLCKVDPTKLLLSDIDYLRAKCRWHYNNVSDYTVNPRVVERIRYLEMFTQCFSLRNDKNDYGCGYEVENVSDHNSFYNYDVYAEQKSIYCDTTTVFDNLINVNVPEREDSCSAAGQQPPQTNYFKIDSDFKSNALTVSVPIVNQSCSSFTLLAGDKNKFPPDLTVKAKTDNKSRLEFLLSPAVHSNKQITKKKREKNEKGNSKVISFVSGKKSKGRFTACQRSTGENFGRKNRKNSEFYSFVETPAENQKNQSFTKVVKSDFENHRAFKTFKEESNSNITQVQLKLTKSSLNVEQRIYKTIDYGTRLKDDTKAKSDQDLTNDNGDGLSNRRLVNSGTNFESDNEDDDHESGEYSAPTKDSLRSELCPVESFRTGNGTIIRCSCNTIDPSSNPRRNDSVNKFLHPIDKSVLQPHSVSFFNDKKSNNLIAAANSSPKSNNKNDDDSYEDDFERGSQISEDSFIRNDCENIESTELFHKYFLNEFIMSVLKPDTDQSKTTTVTHSEANKTLSSGETTENGFTNEDTGYAKASKLPRSQECDFVHGVTKQVKQRTNVNHKNKGRITYMPMVFNSCENCKIKNEIQDKVAWNDNDAVNRCSVCGNVCHPERCANINVIVANKESATLFAVNPNSSDPNLNAIRKGNDTWSGDEEACQIRLQILKPIDNDEKKSVSALKPVKTFAAEVDPGSYLRGLKCKTSKSSFNTSSDSSLSTSKVKTKKNRKNKKRKTKPTKNGDRRKNIEGVLKISRKGEKRKHKGGNINIRIAGGQNGHGYTNNKTNSGQNIYLSCWKKYCVIL